MIRVVFDCGVLLSAIGWQGNPRRCLALVAHRQLRACATTEVWEEYQRRIPAILQTKRPQLNAQPSLNWLLSVAYFVHPTESRKQRSRDVKDDPYLACALSAGAEAIVSNDRDLLMLQRPYGIRILTPLQLLLVVRRQAEGA